VTHGSVDNLLVVMQQLLGYTAKEMSLATATLGFDVSVAELFLPLISGGRVLLRSRELWLRPGDLAGEIVRHGVTVVQTGPSAWTTALQSGQEFPHVRIAISTAEALTPFVAEQLVQISDEGWNLYGPTEATVWATAKRLPQQPLQSEDIRNIGRPLDNVQVLVVDGEGIVVPDGTQGELLIGGSALARGYRNNPALTDASFITRDGARWYRSGDVCERTSAGEILCDGRVDDQIKVRGVRIEPGEVEATLREHPDVLACSVTWYTNDAGTRGLVAGLVVQSAQLNDRSLQAWMSARLPPQMVPAHFIRFAALPHTQSGKVDRNRIRAELDQHRLRVTGGPDAPALSETERQIAGVWNQVLGVQAMHPDDHFFTLGGDSLAAVRVIARVESVCGVAMSTQAVFEAPTLGGLAAMVERAQTQGNGGFKPEYIFSLAEVPHGLPLFFSNANLQLVNKGSWKVPCSLFAITYWAQGSGFLQATDLAALARSHIGGMRSHQPRGPYRLAGFSFGALIALEMAQQLNAMGETVELLFLLDPMQPPHSAEEEENGEAAQAFRSAVVHARGRWQQKLLGRMRQFVSEPRSLPAYLRARLLHFAEQRPDRQWLLYQLLHLHGRKPNPVSTLLLPKDRWPSVWYHARRLAAGYVAVPYAGRTLALFCEDGNRRGAWERLLTGECRLMNVDTTRTQWFEGSTMQVWMDELASAIVRLDSTERRGGD